MKPEQATIYLNRCYQLANIPGKEVGANPHVGAVLVYQDQIIGEGYYKSFGGPHAEVAALQSVAPTQKHLIKDAILFVSLEPCCFYGKTPPCTDAVISVGIREVHIGCLDPFPKVAGKGVALLRAANVNVIIYESNDARQVIAPFATFHLGKRPYITLKWAKSADGYLSKLDEQTWLSNSYSQVYTHRRRHLADAILIGTNTAVVDNPSLTTRAYTGDSPLRLVIDVEHKIPTTHTLLSDEYPTIIFTSYLRELPASKQQIVDLHTYEDVWSAILHYCYTHSLVNLTIEGGGQLLKSAIAANLWDEAVVINTPKILDKGLRAPELVGSLLRKVSLGEDLVLELTNPSSTFAGTVSVSA